VDQECKIQLDKLQSVYCSEGWRPLSVVIYFPDLCLFYWWHPVPTSVSSSVREYAVTLQAAGSLSALSWRPPSLDCINRSCEYS